MFTQLNPPIPLHVLDKGDGLAVGLIDYGPEHNLIWVTALDACGEVWCAPNPSVRFLRNWTMGRRENPLVAASKNGAGPKSEEREPCNDCADVLHHQTQSA